MGLISEAWTNLAPPGANQTDDSSSAAGMSGGRLRQPLTIRHDYQRAIGHVLRRRH